MVIDIRVSGTNERLISDPTGRVPSYALRAVTYMDQDKAPNTARSGFEAFFDARGGFRLQLRLYHCMLSKPRNQAACASSSR